MSTQTAMPASRLWRQIWIGRKGYLFILPTFALLVTFSYYPAFSAFYHAFQRWQPNGVSEWVGLDNFTELYRDTFRAADGLDGSNWIWIQSVGIGMPVLLLSSCLLRKWHANFASKFNVVTAVLALALVWSRQLVWAGNQDFIYWQSALSASVLIWILSPRRCFTVRRTAAIGCAVIAVALFLRHSAGGDFRLACSNLIRVMLFQLTVGLLMPAVVADLLFNLRSARACYAYRVLFTLPLVVPGIVTTLLWMFIYDYDAGVLNQLLELGRSPTAQMIVLFILLLLWAHITAINLLHRIQTARHFVVPAVVLAVLLLAPCVLAGLYVLSPGDADGMGFCAYASSLLHLDTLANHLPLQPRNWLGDSRTALGSIMLMGAPWVGAIPMLLFYAALQGIPASVLESARLDGATGINRIIHIELPMILGQFKVLLVLGIINGIQGFQTVLIMTFGGPGKSTDLPGLIMFKEAFSYGRLGYGTAIGVVMFLVIMGLTFAGMGILGKSGEDH